MSLLFIDKISNWVLPVAPGKYDCIFEYVGIVPQILIAPFRYSSWLWGFLLSIISRPYLAVYSLAKTFFLSKLPQSPSAFLQGGRKLVIIFCNPGFFRPEFSPLRQAWEKALVDSLSSRLVKGSHFL